MINDMDSLNTRQLVILSVCSPFDKQIVEEYTPSKYEVKFQAGAYFTDERICEYNDFDMFSDHISNLNHRMSEMTAWYTAWRYLKCEYIGISHYRRKYGITDELLNEYMNLGYDGVIGELNYSEKNIREEYLEYHYGCDWKTMMDILREREPDYYKVALSFFEGHLWFTANMFILKRSVFVSASEFVFPILLEFCKRRPEKKDVYQRRDAGFLAERLLSLYFMYHREEYQFIEVPRKLLMTEEQESVCLKNKTEQEIVIELTKSMKNRNIARFSELVMSKGDFQSEALSGAYIMLGIIKAEMLLEKETMLDYLKFSDDFIEMYQFIKMMYQNIGDFLEIQNANTIKAMNELIDVYKMSKTAIYKFLELNGKVNEEVFICLISYFRSFGYAEHQKYFCEKAKELFYESEKINYLLMVVEGRE